jgi:MFS family permease
VGVGAGLTRATTTRHRGRRELGLSLAFAAVANRGYSVALVVYVYDATHSSAWVAASAAARYLPGIVTSSLAPRLLDRYPPRTVLFWADVCCTLALAAMATSVLVAASPAIPIAFAALVRAAASGQPPAAARLLPAVAGGEDLSAVAARQAAVDKLTLLVGPAIGGVLLLVVTPAGSLFILAALFALAAIISLGLPSPSMAHAGPSGPKIARAAVRSVRTHATAGIALFIALAALSGFVYGTDTVLLAVLANTHLHLGDAGYGLMFGGLGAGGLIAAPAVNRIVRRPRLAGWLALGMAIYCLPSVLVIHIDSSIVVLVLEAVRGAGALTVDLIALTELQRIVLPQGLPVLTARLTSIVFGAVAAGALASPVMLNRLGTVGTFTLLGVAPPICVLAAYPQLRRCDRRMTQRLEELGPRISVLESLGLLQATSRPVLERLAADVVEYTVLAGTTVIVEGDPAEAFYVVQSGDLDVFVGDRQVNDLHAGDWFGEIGLLEGLPRTATVRASGASHLYRIGGTAFLEAFAQLPPSPSLLDSVNARLATTTIDGDISSQTTDLK